MSIILTLKKRGEVLDLGCGAGKLSKFFYEKGFKVTAIDKSPQVVNILKKHFKNKIEIKQKKLEKLKLKKDYDIIIAKNVLHLIDTKKEAINLIKKIQKNTKKEGINLIIGLTTKDPFYCNKKFFIKPKEIKKMYKGWKCLFSKVFFTNMEKHDNLPFHRHHLFCGLFLKKC